MPAKRCPLCHRGSEGTAWQCPCGYEFGQSIERVREMLRSQRTNARIAVVILLALTAAALYAAATGYGVLGGVGFVMLIVWTLRNVRTLWITRASLKQLANRDLPVAILKKG